MPSTTSNTVSRPFASSTVITPSLPTFSIASAMMSPMVESLLAEIVPTCAISRRSLVGLERFFSSLVTAETARSIPRLSDIGSWPAATILTPSVKIERASTVAVVVPSPATSEVLEATSLTICAPMFSNLSLSSISFATDTPSLVMVGAPKLRSRTTLRPLGPRVTLTAFDRMLTPFTILFRTFSPKRTSLAAMIESPDAVRLVRLGDDADDVVFAHVQQVLVFQLEFLARVLAEEDLLADLDAHRDQLAVVVGLAGTAGHDFADRRL